VSSIDYNNTDNFHSKRFFDPLFRDKHIKLIEATIPAPGIGKTVWEFTNPDLWANNSQNLHGGAQATIFDILTSLTLSTIAKPGFWLFGGVSRTLSVTYLRPAPSDEPIIVECEVSILSSHRRH
jgi:acyl-coenzyme A thioesterase 13